MSWFKKLPPDPLLVQDQLQALQATLAAYGPAFYMSAFLWILTKEEKKFTSVIKPAMTVPFLVNRVQQHLIAAMERHNRILKARQQGLTTFLCLYRLMLPITTNGGRNGMLISQDQKYAELHFQIPTRALNLYGVQDPKDALQNELNHSLRQNLLHTKFQNRRELFFDQLDSRLIVESAGKLEAGQGVTLQHLVCSEVARWTKCEASEVISNVVGSLTDEGTKDEESTADGAGGYFYEQSLLGMQNSKAQDAKFFFFPWYWSDEYSYERRMSDKFADQLEKDLKADELVLIQKIHDELKCVAWNGEMTGKIPRMYLGKIAWRRRQKIVQKRNFDEKYPETAEIAFLVSGKQYFDRDVLIARLMDLVSYKPLQTYSNGAAEIYKKRIPGRRYVIGADPARGIQITKEDTDFDAAVVLDLETGEEVASLHERVRTDEFALDLADLGRYYNNAVIAVERTGDGAAVMQALVSEAKYPAIYKFREWLRRDKKITPNSIVELEGIPTTPKTRPVLLNFLNRHVSNHPETIWDRKFLSEALVFVRDETGKPAAGVGAHDDRVSARWLAHGARLHLLGFWDPLSYKSESYVGADEVPDSVVA